MRVVFVGGSGLAIRVADRLLEQKHEVIIIEQDREKIERLKEKMACSFLHGDGSRPAVLQEAGPDQTNLLFCLTGNDLANIVASMVAKSLGFRRVVTMIDEVDYRTLCVQLGLTDIIIPTETISRHLVDLVEGRDILELSTMIKGDARFFSFIVREDESAQTVEELDLPKDSRAICLYRGEEFVLVSEKSPLKKGDEVVILTRSGRIEELRKRWGPPTLGESAPPENAALPDK